MHEKATSSTVSSIFKLILCLRGYLCPHRTRQRRMEGEFFFFRYMEDRAQWEITPQAHPTFAKSQRWTCRYSRMKISSWRRKESGQNNKELTFIKSVKQYAHITNFQTFHFRLPTPQVEKNLGLNHPIPLISQLCSHCGILSESTPVSSSLVQHIFPHQERYLAGQLVTSYEIFWTWGLDYFLTYS